MVCAKEEELDFNPTPRRIGFEAVIAKGTRVAKAGRPVKEKQLRLQSRPCSMNRPFVGG